MSRATSQNGEASATPTIEIANSGDEPTCLSSENHQISDHLSHFLGCVEFGHRKGIFRKEGELWKNEFEQHKRDRRYSLDNNNPIDGKVDEKMCRSIDTCIDELVRIKKLRKALKTSPQHKELVERIDANREQWRASAKADIQKVGRWSKREQKLEDLEVDRVIENLKADAKTYLPTPKRSYTDKIKKLEEQDYDPENDLKTYVIEWKQDSQRSTLTRSDVNLKGRFPDQRVPLNALLDVSSQKPQVPDAPDAVSLAAEQSGGKVRYFHFPANNMIWVEKAIAAYFKDSLDLDHVEENGGRTKSHMILRPQYWRGQERGTRSSPVHMRHLRPLCKAVSSDPEKDDEADNIVLFMPYLHWETDRKRIHFTEWMNQVSKDHEERFSSGNMERKRRRKEAREGLHKPEWFKELKQPLARNRKGGLIGVVGDLGYRKAKEVKNKLGRYLLDAAALFEVMSNYRDQMFIQKYLNEEPPLHPRRTLDQAYYWTLDNTESRDRDQVVYRATRAMGQSFHRYDPENKIWQAHRRQSDKDRDSGEGCRDCRDHVRKVSRLVMVDQLWLWILDANTVLTFFPKRYGANKHDVSGVHKSIRMRLKSAPKNRIRSAFDLGLLIIEECCSTFFDRTKTPDPKQPQVIDQFAQAIADMTNKYTNASQQLWLWTELAKSCYTSNIKPHANLHIALLDINHEGKLHREIKDIIEEIDIMLYITRSQKEVIKNYISQVEEIINPDGEFGPRATTRAVDDDKQVTEFTPGPPMVRARRPSKAGPPRLPHVRQPEIYDAFMRHADEMTGKISGHIEELEQLRSSAQTTSDSIKDLLALKQQQASVLQAWQSGKEAEEMARQGQSIMMFTVITIIFAPLSFVTALFSMQNEKQWTMGYQLKLIFAISLSIAFLAILLAFNRWVRVFFPLNSIVYSPIMFTTTWLIVNVPSPKFSLYMMWLRVTELSHDVTRKIDETAEAMKARIMHEEHKRKKSRETIERGSREKRKAKFNHNKHTQGQKMSFGWLSHLRHRSRNCQEQDSQTLEAENGTVELGYGK